jgi:hypothetical protein
MASELHWGRDPDVGIKAILTPLPGLEPLVQQQMSEASSNPARVSLLGDGRTTLQHSAVGWCTIRYPLRLIIEPTDHLNHDAGGMAVWNRSTRVNYWCMGIHNTILQGQKCPRIIT